MKTKTLIALITLTPLALLADSDNPLHHRSPVPTPAPVRYVAQPVAAPMPTDPTDIEDLPQPEASRSPSGRNHRDCFPFCEDAPFK